MLAHDTAPNGDAGVMPALECEGGGLSLCGLCALGDEDARGGLEIDF